MKSFLQRHASLSIAVLALLAAAGYRAVACVPDLGGRPRVSLAQAPA